MFTRPPARRDPAHPMRIIGERLLSYISVALGILSILIGFLPCVNIVAIAAGLAGVITGIIAFRQGRRIGRRGGYAAVGIILSVLGIVMSIILTREVIDKMINRDRDAKYEEHTI